MAGVQYPDLYAAQRLDADLAREMLPFYAIKPTTTSRSSTTTLADDPDLVVSLPRTGTWMYELWLNYTGASIGTGDLKVRMNYSGTSTFDVFGVHGINTTSTSQFTAAGGTQAGPGVAVGTNGGNFTIATIGGSLVVTTTGDVSFQWAQNTSSATSTNLRQGSQMRVWQVS